MQGIADELSVIIRFSFFSFFVLLPLAVLKLFEIAIWIYNHVEIL